MFVSRTLALGLAATAAALAACGGGGSGGGSYSPPAAATAAPTATPTTAPTTAPTSAPTSAPTGGAPLSTQQVVSMALPTSAIGYVSDPTFGTLGGYAQSQYSQAMAFAPGTQIMLRNGDASSPHTLNVLSTTGFPASPSISTAASGGSTFGAGFASGALTPGALAGPFTLTAGTYYIGCAFHYASSGMRGVITVAANATPGPAATAKPSTTTTPPPYTGGGYGY